VKITPTGYWTDLQPNDHGHDVGLANWIAAYLPKDEKVWDLGCGNGAYVRILREAGHLVIGVDGKFPEYPAEIGNFMIEHDLTQPITLLPGSVMCLEVGEHVPAEYESVLLDNITRLCTRHLVLSWAVRGQGGDGHVNCKDNDEVTTLLEALGFEYLPWRSQEARAAVCGDGPHFRNTVMVFRRTE
jgi:hypothetical protein